MGPTAQPERILRFLVFLCWVAAPLVAEAAATAQGVALSTSAGCGNANLDLTLTTSGATTELGQWTKTGDNSVSVFKTPTTALASFGPGTFQGYKITISPQQPPNTLIGAYAYVGDDPPAPSNTAEFFVYYNCATREVLYSCYGPYGRCPQTAQQAADLTVPRVPTLSAWALVLTALLVAGGGALTLRNGARSSAR
jgi:hypothetical protein